MLVLNPGFTVGAEKFKTANQTFLDEVHKSSPLPNSDGVTIPGDRAAKTKAINSKNGYLEIDDSLWKEIELL